MRYLLSSIWLTGAAASALTAPGFSAEAVLPEDFAEPSLIQDYNRQYYVFGSNSTQYNIPIAQSLDFNSWTLLPQDALPNPGSWAAGKPNVQGPDITRLGNGQFVLLYSAALAKNSSIQCIGVATSRNIRGPYQPNPEPYICPEDEGGASDPSAFYDPADSSLYIMYKVNGNDLVSGGLCGNVSPTQSARSTPIMIQKVDSSVPTTKIGSPSIILQRGANEGPTLGAPSLTASWHPDAVNGYAYFLFYSSGCKSSVKHDTRYATNLAGIAAGEYVKAAAPLMASGDGKGLHSPSSLDISGDAQHVVFSSWEEAFVKGRRQLRTGLVKIDGLTVTI